MVFLLSIAFLADHQTSAFYIKGFASEKHSEYADNAYMASMAYAATFGISVLMMIRDKANRGSEADNFSEIEARNLLAQHHNHYGTH
tara:strand:- start:55 stop:315 length:261 start_codon:yes stop_codon:yes gene_type:complete